MNFDGLPLKRGMVLRSASGSTCVYIDACGPDDDESDGAIVVWDDRRESCEVSKHAQLTLACEDPGTRGHILAALRDAYCDPGAFACDTGAVDPARGWAFFGGRKSIFGTSEAAVLAAAWDARPNQCNKPATAGGEV